jgi:hypothetical protein
LEFWGVSEPIVNLIGTKNWWIEDLWRDYFVFEIARALKFYVIVACRKVA